MRTGDLLHRIRPLWLSKVSHRLAGEEGMRASFLQQIETFYSLLEQAVETRDPSQIDSLLQSWVQARTQTELEQEEASLSPVIGNMLVITFEVLRESNNADVVAALFSEILPIFTHAVDYVSQQEVKIHVDHISSELETANAALERLDKSKSDFIAVAAHELRTPLTLLEGYTSMLRETLPEGTEVYLEGIDSGSRRLRQIVDDMLDVSMIDNNLLSIHFQPVWINRLFSQIYRDLGESVRARNLSLDIRPFEGSDELTYGDGERLMQAFRNLITNAIKFTPDGGQITVDGRLLPGFIEVTVADTGIGIDPEFQTLIFEKFGRLGNISLHSSSKIRFKGGGPGLGLPITKGIIEAHGGAIWVESPGFDEKGCPGSVFHVLLPVRKECPDDKSAKLFNPSNEIVSAD